MNKEQFLNYVNQVIDGKLLPETDLEDITTKYPYCQTGQLLHYLILLQNSNIQHYQQLRLAAAYCIDRKRLKVLTENYRNLQKADALKQHKYNESGEHKRSNASGIESNKTESGQQTEARQNIENTATQEQLSDSITFDKALVQTETAQKAITSDKPSQTKSEKQKTKQELIDQFIKNSPRISRSKSDFYNPEDYSKTSQIDKEDIVSETLATIYFKQGNYTKAISTYQKLILKVPQKSSFFAAQIEKIKEVQNLNN